MTAENGHKFRWLGGDFYECERCGIVLDVDAMMDVEDCPKRVSQ